MTMQGEEGDAKGQEEEEASTEEGSGCVFRPSWWCVRVPLTHFSISRREPPSSSHKLTIQPPNYPPLARSLISPLHYLFKVHVCFNYDVLRSVLPS
jgi:hypothetical protein